MRKLKVNNDDFITVQDSEILLNNSDSFKLLVHLYAIVSKVNKLSKRKRITFFHYLSVVPALIQLLREFKLIYFIEKKYRNMYSDNKSQLAKLLAKHYNITIIQASDFIDKILLNISLIVNLILEIKEIFTKKE